MSPESRTGLYAAPESSAAALAAAVAWLWRLDQPQAVPTAGAVGLGGLDEAAELAAMVGEERLAGAVILCPEPGERVDWVPARSSVTGIARFPDIGAITGRFTIFGDGTPALESDRGAHAVREGRLLAIGAGPGDWGNLSLAPLLAALAPFLGETLQRPLLALPAVGVLRLDDFPGTAQHQVEGRAAGDRRQTRRMRRLRRAFRRSGGTLSVAVAAQAIAVERLVPLDEAWPRAVRQLRLGAHGGELEPVGHGLLHLDPHAHARGEVEFREFQSLDQGETKERIAAGLDWQERVIARPATFVAPAWAYGRFGVAAAIEMGMAPWLPPEAGPLLDDGRLRETLMDGPPGLHRLDYRPLAALARLGMPPTVVTHGALLDDRLRDLRVAADLVPLARLWVRRDLFRLPFLRGLRWVGAGRYLELMRAHAGTELRGDRASAPDGYSPRVLSA